MMTDIRLIDANALKKLRHDYIQGHIKFDGNEYDLIDKCPTINAVQVPCKIGDTVFGIRNYRGKTHVQKGFVGEMFFTKDMKLMIVVKHICYGHWGEKVFATYEEAELALKTAGDK